MMADSRLTKVDYASFAKAIVDFDKERYARVNQPIWTPLKEAGPTGPELASGRYNKQLFFPWPHCFKCKKRCDTFVPKHEPMRGGVSWTVTCHGETEVSFLTDDEFFAASKIESLLAFSGDMESLPVAGRLDATEIIAAACVSITSDSLPSCLAAIFLKNAIMRLNGMVPVSVTVKLWRSLSNK